MIATEKVVSIISLLQMLIPLVIALLSVGIVYGTLIMQIKTLKEDSKKTQINNDKLIALETKMDFIILQFKKQNDL
jgi:hypothetical protein